MDTTRSLVLLLATTVLASCATPDIWPLATGRADGAKTQREVIAAQGDPVQTLSAAYAARHVDIALHPHTTDPLHDHNANASWANTPGGDTSWATTRPSSAPARPGTLGAHMAQASSAAMTPAMSSPDALAHTHMRGNASNQSQIQNQANAGARSGLFAIHLASYRSVSDAQRGWRILSDRSAGALDGLSARVEYADLGARGAYQRLKAGPFFSRADADARCALLVSQGLYCQATDFAGADL